MSSVTMSEQHTPEWLTALIGAGSALGVGALGIIGAMFARKPAEISAEADEQKAINQGFSALLEATRIALGDTRLALEASRAELVQARTQRDEFKLLLEQERARGIQRDGELNQLRAMVEGLERLLQRNNIPVPPRKAYGAQQASVVETTLRQDAVNPPEAG